MLPDELLEQERLAPVLPAEGCGVDAGAFCHADTGALRGEVSLDEETIVPPHKILHVPGRGVREPKPVPADEAAEIGVEKLLVRDEREFLRACVRDEQVADPDAALQGEKFPSHAGGVLVQPEEPEFLERGSRADI